jgi:hypothetical protein
MRRSFVDTLRDVRGGEVLEDLSERLGELVHAVQTANASGELILRIKVAPMKGSSEAVVVTDKIDAKLPKIVSAGTVMFTTPDGNLQRNNYKQPELPGITLAASQG